MSSTKRRPIIQCLRVLWVLCTLWCELLVFYSSVGHCSWPDSALLSPTHVLLVADPQILDHRSYPERSPILTYLTQLIVDLNIRKSWRAALRKRPDAVIFLGDMMDGGRSTTTDAEYEQYYHRFQSIFSIHSQIPIRFIPGNHDIGLQTPASISGSARSRYKSHFGDLNSCLSIANHTIVLLDAMGLIEEDYQRADKGQSYSEWHALIGGAVEFTKAVAKEYSKDPVVLFSHVPLYRNTGDCGPLREKGTIRPGGGLEFGYQNTLGKDATNFLLQTLQPSIAFSGDDHDYCVYNHITSSHEGTYSIREVSVKSISMSMGIRRPGFQLLSLDPWDGRGDRPAQTQADMPCFLPDQLGIYLSIYLPLFLASTLVVLILNAPCVRLSMRQPSRRMSSLQRAVEIPLLNPYLRMNNPESIEDDNESAPSRLPYPVSASLGDGQYTSSLRQLGIRTYNRFSDSTLSQRSGSRRGCASFFRSSLLDIWDVAVFPFGVFALISIYMMFT